MTGQQAIDYIHSFSWLGSRPGLERTGTLLDLIGNPEEKLKFVHIVGTNGKGSTAAMLASVLTAAGLRTGLYTSPYITSFHERMMTDGVPISDEMLGKVTEFVREKAETMAEHPTEFELVTCIALEYFLRSGCQIVVLEAGMGGRLDSTNVIPSPEAVIVTHIGLDHTAQLGNTVEKIAGEKAGVIKPGTTVVLYRQQSSVEEVVAEVCREKDAALRLADSGNLRLNQNSLAGQDFDWKEISGLHISLLGEHQRHNVSAVLETVEVLREKGWDIPEDAVRRGLAGARWPGRFEVLDEHPFFVADGGHNPQCAETVAENLRTYFPGKKAVFLIGVMADKDYGGLTDCVKDLVEAFVTVTPDNPRALSANELSRFLQERYGKSAVACESVREGVETARRLAGPDGLVCYFGSLYAVGQVRACFPLTSGKN